MIRENLKILKCISNIFIWLGVLLIFISSFLELSDTNFISSMSQHPFIFIVGVIFLEIGIFKNLSVKRNDSIRRNDTQLKRKRVFYRFLLGIGLLPFLYILCFTFYYSLCRNMGMFCWFIILSCFIYWQILLLGLLVVIVSIVQLSDIKKLSRL